MELMPDDIRARLLANGATEEESDHIPVVKFFDPCGPATWIITEMMPDDPDILFGLCDLGMDYPELGTVRLSELQSVRGKLGLGIERDLLFRPRFTLSAFAEAATRLDRITEDERELAAAARALGLPDNPELPPDFAAVT
jgi:Protein of unknown function (DUF2958)